MDTRDKIKEVSKRIRFAPDSDDVADIVRKAIEDAMDDNILGLQLRLFLKQLDRKLNRRLSMAKDLIEYNNLKRGIDMIQYFEPVIENNPPQYESN